MKTSIALLSCIFAACLGSAAYAEIYESTDAQGNPVFTDTPTSGSEEIKLQEGNIAASVPPRAPEEAPAAITAARPQVIVIPNSHNQAVDDEYLSGRRHSVRDAQERVEVGDADIE